MYKTCKPKQATSKKLNKCECKLINLFNREQIRSSNSSQWSRTSSLLASRWKTSQMLSLTTTLCSSNNNLTLPWGKIYSLKTTWHSLSSTKGRKVWRTRGLLTVFIIRFRRKCRTRMLICMRNTRQIRRSKLREVCPTRALRSKAPSSFQSSSWARPIKCLTHNLATPRTPASWTPSTSPTSQTSARSPASWATMAVLTPIQTSKRAMLPRFPLLRHRTRRWSR